MKTFKILLTLFLCSFAFVGCDDDEIVEQKPITYDFTINEKEITIGFEGGTAKVTYQLTGDTQEALKITTPEWITSINTETANEISFEVAANATTEAREGNLSVEFHGIKQDVLVKQDAKLEEQQKEKFNIDLKAEDLTITMNVTPNNDEYHYMYDIVNEGVVNYDFNGDFSLFVQQVIDEMICLYVDMQGMTTEEAVKKITSQGASSYTYSKIQKANTTFIGYAVELDMEGQIIGDIFTEKITTRPTQPSNNEISIEVSDIAASSATLSFTTSNNDPWLYVTELTENWVGMSDEEIMKTMCDIFSLKELATTGNCTTPVTDMEANSEYTVFAFGYQEGTYNTALYRKDFKTLESDPEVPEDGKMSFKFKVYEVTKNSIKAGATCNPEDALFYWDICKAEKTAAQVEKSLNNQAKEQMEQSGITSLAQYFRFMANNPNPYNYKGLDANREYKFYAVGIDPNTGAYITDFIFSDPVKTLEN